MRCIERGSGWIRKQDRSICLAVVPDHLCAGPHNVCAVPAPPKGRIGQHVAEAIEAIPLVYVLDIDPDNTSVAEERVAFVNNQVDRVTFGRDQGAIELY